MQGRSWYIIRDAGGRVLGPQNNELLQDADRGSVTTLRTRPERYYDLLPVWQFIPQESFSSGILQLQAPKGGNCLARGSEVQGNFCRGEGTSWQLTEEGGSGFYVLEGDGWVLTATDVGKVVLEPDENDLDDTSQLWQIEKALPYQLQGALQNGSWYYIQDAETLLYAGLVNGNDIMVQPEEFWPELPRWRFLAVDRHNAGRLELMGGGCLLATGIVSIVELSTECASELHDCGLGVGCRVIWYYDYDPDTKTFGFRAQLKPDLATCLSLIRNLPVREPTPAFVSTIDCRSQSRGSRERWRLVPA